MPPPQKGKHMYELPPEVLLQKCKCECAQTSTECEPKVEELAVYCITDTLHDVYDRVDYKKEVNILSMSAP
jgi:hypothetical protein